MFFSQGGERLETELTEKMARIFTQHGILKQYQPGQLLIERGEPATQSCFLTEGQARTFCANPDGDLIPLFYIEPNNMICSESLLLHAKVYVSVEAITPVKMYVLPGERFLQLWTADGNEIQALFAPLIDRLTLLSDYICCAHFKENQKKVAYFLYSCYRRMGEVVTYTNEQVADITGISRVSVNRILNQFAREGILELHYKKIRLLDIQRLAQRFDAVGYFMD